MSDDEQEGFGEIVLQVECVLSFEEEHKKPIYACRFCDNIPAYSNYFASAAANMVTVYQLHEDPETESTTVEMVQAYCDNNLEELYYCCSWASLGTNVPLLMVAGGLGVIKGISLCSPFELSCLLLGHGDSVYDLRTHPVDDGLVLSASKDESIRLWNVRTSVCIAIFAGSGGHRMGVIGMDIHPLGNVFVSSSIDTNIKIWNLQKPTIAEAIKLSDTFPRGLDPDSPTTFRTLTQQTPLFSTNQVHSDYVDSVKWVGDCVLSKAAGEPLALWAPDSLRGVNASIVLRRYALSTNKIWYTPMDIFLPFDWIAIGGDDGRVSQDVENLTK